MIGFTMLVARVLIRAYPSQWREAWAGECLQTFVEGCRAASSTGGSWRVLKHAVVEWIDMMRNALRIRRGSTELRQASTSGEPPSRRPLGNDLRLAWRALLSTPAHTSIAVLTLALGIGANAGLYSVLDALLFRPMPFADGERLVELVNKSQESSVQFPGFSRALMREWRAQTDLFDRIEAFDDGFAMFNAGQGAEVEDMAYVTPGLFGLLGATPLDGRLFVEGDGRDGSDALAILSERLWRSHFGARASVIGSSLQINGRPHQVIGVMPASFHFPYRSTEIWLPRDWTTPPSTVAANATMQPLARLASGVNVDMARAEVQQRGVRLQQSANGETSITAALTRRADGDERQGRMLQVLAAAVAFVLLIVCANLANLSLSKALTRGRDVAVRSALGASRKDLVRESLVEHALLAVVGAVAGLGVAWAVVGLANEVLPIGLLGESLNPIDLDVRVLLVAVVAGVITPLFFGLPAALLGTRPDVAGALTQQSRSTTGSRAARRWRNGLVVVEVTLAMVLLLGAALMGRTLYTLVTVDRGFPTAGLVTVQVGLPTLRYSEAAVRDQFTERVLAELSRVPEISTPTAGNVPPSPSGNSYGALEFAHRPGQPTDRFPVPSYRVWPDYFDRIGLRLLEGRTFAENEPRSAVIVSESFAKRFWPDSSAVGGQFRFTGSNSWYTVVGVSTEVRQMGLDDVDGSFEWFAPMRTPPGVVVPRRPGGGVIAEHRTFVARTTTAPAALAAMERVVHQIDPDVVIWRSTSVDELFADAVAQPRLVLAVLATLGALGLILAAAGIYGVLSYLVTLRQREFGVRLALGARPESVFSLVVRYGLTLTGVGLVLGAVAAVFLVRLMRSLLYEVEPSDPTAIAAVVTVLLLAGVTACWRPARRAMRADPVTLLRQ